MTTSVKNSGVYSVIDDAGVKKLKRIYDYVSSAAVDLLSTVAAVKTSPFPEEEYNLPVLFQVGDFVNPTGNIVVDEAGITVPNGIRVYINKTLAANKLAVGDAFRSEFRVISGASGIPYLRYMNGAAQVATQNYVLVGGRYIADGVVPATTTHIRIDWTNATGGDVKITRPRIAKAVASRTTPISDRFNMKKLVTRNADKLNVFSGYVSLAKNSGAGAVPVLNGDGTVTIDADTFVTLTGQNFSLRPIGAPLTILIKLSSEMVVSATVQFVGAVASTALVSMDPLDDNWYRLSINIPAVGAQTHIRTVGIQVDNRIPFKGYVPAPVVLEKVLVFDGLDIPSGVIDGASDEAYPDDELVLLQPAAGVMEIQQRVGEVARYGRWHMIRHISVPDRSAGWRIDNLDTVARAGEFAFSPLVDLTDGGEFEVAILEQGKADFMGGETHDDHRETRPLQLMVDGSLLTPDGDTDIRCRRIEAIQHAQMFEMGNPVDNLTFTIVTRWLWEHGKMTLGHWLRCERTITVGAFYLSMAPTLRAAFGTVLAHPEYTPIDLSADGHGNIGLISPRLIAIGDDGARLEMKVTKGWNANCRTLIADTAGRHKLYFSPVPAGSVVVAGTEFDWECEYITSMS